MLTLIISFIISFVCIIASKMAGWGPSAIMGLAIGGFILSQVLIGLIFRKKTAAVTNELQEMMTKSQRQLSNKANQMAMKAGGNVKLVQRQLERDQQQVFQKALDFTARFEPFKKWNLLMGRQIDTMRLQFLYQLKDFEQVDALLAKGLFKGPMMMEPLPVAMKMARQFKNKDVKGAEKTFNWHIKFFRGNRGALLYGLMSWIYVKQGESEKARQLLLKGKEATASDVLSSNWQLLSNGKEKQFSNKGLGDEWYSLYLETPPAPKAQRVRGGQKGGRRF